MPTLTSNEVLLILDFLEEIEALIDEDDGTFFTLPLLNKHSDCKEVVNAIIERQ